MDPVSQIGPLGTATMQTMPRAHGVPNHSGKHSMGNTSSLLHWSLLVCSVYAAAFDLSDNWTLQGSAKWGLKNQLQLTSAKTQKGAAWNPRPWTFGDFELDISFTVRGLGRFGGEGFSVFLTEQALEQGEVFGSSERFKGLAVVFDSKDNDEMGNNPAVSAHLMDGTVPYSLADDGVAHQLAGCVVDYRNKQYPMKAKVLYESSSARLSVFLDVRGQDKYQRCLSVVGVIFPAPEYFLGVSAQTRDIAELHEISSISVNGKPRSATRAPVTPQMMMPQVQHAPAEIPEAQQILHHEKLDAMVRAIAESVAPRMVGEALDEIEQTVLRAVNFNFGSLARNVELLAQDQVRSRQILQVLSQVDFPQLEAMIADAAHKSESLEKQETLDRSSLWSLFRRVHCSTMFSI